MQLHQLNAVIASTFSFS